ncbi:MAG: VCBS repeat-containing protein, partial [Desulfurellaceae bacterium]|nr:VCBS repeat-containing protein [Desulfurellaceae bacterium]
DTQSVCNDSDNGFGLLFNWNLLGDGTHTVHARADGEVFGRATFTVTTLGQEFLTGVEKRARLKDFPDTGTDLVVAWQQSLQNFVIIGAGPVEPPQYAAPVRVTGPLGRDEDGEAFAPNQASAASGDINGDGHEDVVFSLWAGDITAPKATPSPIVILLNDGAGSLVDKTATLIVGPIPEVFLVRQFIIEDFNGDGQNDIFMDNHGREDTFDGEQNRLLLSEPDGRLRDVTARNLPQVSDFSHGSSAADVDGDGDIDVWVNNVTRAPSYLMLNDGSGAFSIVADIWLDFGDRESIIGTNGRFPDALIGSQLLWTHFIDAENDGDADLYIGLIEAFENLDGSRSNRTGILLNDGTGRFTLSNAAAIPPSPIAIDGIWRTQDSIRTDLNQDGLHDLLLYQSDQMFRGHFVQVLISNGDGSFRDETSLRLPTQVRAFQGIGWPGFWFRDINGDGQNEILNFHYGPDGQPSTDVIDSYLNMGNGVFTPLPDDFVNVSPIVAAVDVNGDGWVDFIDAKYGFNQLGVLEAELFLTTAINPNNPP